MSHEEGVSAVPQIYSRSTTLLSERRNVCSEDRYSRFDNAPLFVRCPRRGRFARWRDMLVPHSERVTPRVLPKRREGREIFTAILDATEQQLIHRGLHALTTNHIAETAGVSIGSFYRYFGNKETAVAEVQRRRERLTIGCVIDRLSQVSQSSLEAKVRVAVEEIVNGPSQGCLALRRALLDVPRSFCEPAAAEAEGELHAFLSREVESFFPNAEADLLVFVTMYAVELVVEAAVVRRPELLDDPRFVDHLVRLVLGYVEQFR